MSYPLVPVTILAQIDGSNLNLILDPPLDEVEIVGGTEIVISPKNEAKTFALQFVLLGGYAFEIPAIVPQLLGGEATNSFGIAPTGPATALLVNTDDIPQGGVPQTYNVDFLVRGKNGNGGDGERIDIVIDPTVVNNPIGT